MVAEGALADEFAGTGDFDTLGGTFVSLKFWHIFPLCRREKLAVNNISSFEWAL